MAEQTSTTRQDASPAPQHSALLLLGPTGSGKTPLGELIERRGLWGERLVHFDFGAQMRSAVEQHRSHLQAAAVEMPHAANHIARAQFSAAEIVFLENVLERGVLLEDEHFHLAARLLRAFLQSRCADEKTWVVLNGLPRHVGQARALAPLAHVRAVVVLDCPAEVVLQRIRRNVAGDRSVRTDDEPELVARKLGVYEERTAPLLAWYEQRAARVERLTVGPTTTPAEMWGELAGRRSAAMENGA